MKVFNSIAHPGDGIPFWACGNGGDQGDGSRRSRFDDIPVTTSRRWYLSDRHGTTLVS